MMRASCLNWPLCEEACSTPCWKEYPETRLSGMDIVERTECDLFPACLCDPLSCAKEADDSGI